MGHRINGAVLGWWHGSVAAALLLGAAQAGMGGVFTTSYTDGGSWSTIYAQGFSPSVTPSPDPALAAGDTVYLTQVQFFKSGNSDNATNVRLAVINGMYPLLTGLTSSSAAVVGLSSNTVAGTGALASGDAITFSFDNLPLVYGNSYSAGFFNVGGDGSMTPVLVSALTANYVASGSDFVPATNYGALDDYTYAVSNFISGGYYSTFNHAGDANFVATLATAVPEPAGALGLLLGVPVMARRRR